MDSRETDGRFTQVDRHRRPQPGTERKYRVAGKKKSIKKTVKKTRRASGPLGVQASLETHTALHRVQFTLQNEDLEIELPIDVPLEQPLSFQVQGDLTLAQLREIVTKVSAPDVEVTDAYYEFLTFIEQYDLGPKSDEYFQELADFLELASWFDTGIHIWIGEWSEILSNESASEPVEVDENDHLSRILRILERNETIMARIDDASQKAAIASKEYVDQKEACHVLKISDTKLRRYCNNLAAYTFKPHGLNGILEGKLWRFERQEMYRFSQWYWGDRIRHRRDTDSPDPGKMEPPQP